MVQGLKKPNKVKSGRFYVYILNMNERSKTRQNKSFSENN